MVSFFFKVPRARLFFHDLPPRFRSCVLSRCNHPLSLPLALADAFQQPLAVLPLFYDGRYSTLLPLSDDYLCLRAKREMKAKLFDSAPRRLSALAVSLLLWLFFIYLSLSFSLPFYACLPPSSSLPLSLYTRSFSVSLSFTLSFSLASFRYIRQPHFALWLTRSCLLSFLPPRDYHPPSTLLIFPPLSLKLKSIVAPRARGLCRKHCYPHQLLSTTDFKKRIFRD